MSEKMKIWWNRGSADVEWNGKRARFDGELGEGGFAADSETMKWMFPERDILVPEEERNIWICAINDYYANMKGERLFFLNEKEWKIWHKDVIWRIRTGIRKLEGNEIKFSFPSGVFMDIEFHGKIARFSGSWWDDDTFWAVAASMKWLIPRKRKATDEERSLFIQEVKQAYQKAPRKIRRKFKFSFRNERGKELK